MVVFRAKYTFDRMSVSWAFLGAGAARIISSEEKNEGGTFVVEHKALWRGGLQSLKER